MCRSIVIRIGTQNNNQNLRRRNMTFYSLQLFEDSISHQQRISIYAIEYKNTRVAYIKQNKMLSVLLSLHRFLRFQIKLQNLNNFVLFVLYASVVATLEMAQCFISFLLDHYILMLLPSRGVRHIRVNFNWYTHIYVYIVYWITLALMIFGCDSDPYLM